MRKHHDRQAQLKLHTRLLEYCRNTDRHVYEMAVSADLWQVCEHVSVVWSGSEDESRYAIGATGAIAPNADFVLSERL
jgi:hypothetical protein